MTWDRGAVAAALVDVLTPLDPTVSVFGAPPSTFNAPAYVVWYPQVVDYGTSAMTVDVALLPVLCAAGPGEWDRVDELVRMAREAVLADTTLGGRVPAARAASQSGWRILGVGGADLLVADLILEIRQ